jgi:hypothetical protein
MGTLRRADAPDDYTTSLTTLPVGSDSANGDLSFAPQAELTVHVILTPTLSAAKAAMSAALEAQVICQPLGGMVRSGLAEEAVAGVAALMQTRS